MDRSGPLRLGLALSLVLVVAQQTFADQSCRTGCRGSTPHLFKYAPGTTYKYNYEGKIDISLSSAEGQLSTTDVKAVVLLTPQADCNQIIRLQNVQIFTEQGNGKKHAHIPDVEKPIRINFHDGHVEDSICTSPGDNQNSLNIKRAIASLFQVNAKSGYETDIFGVCHTEVAQHQEGGDLIIQKSRELNKCAYRENLRQDFFATTFNVNSEIKSSPILNGDYNAKLRIKNGILNQANVVESYLYVPFSVGKNGARAEVTSKLHLTGTSKDNPKADVSVPKSIIFDNPHPVDAPSSNVNIILNAVKEVVKSIDVVVGEKTAKEFVTLIKTIRAAKKDDLLSVYNQVRSGVGFGDKVVAKKVFLDALLQAGVGDSVEVAITLLKSHELNEVEQRLVYLGMSLVRHTTLGSIKTATQLLNLPNLPQEAYLGIGNLVGRYCKHHSCDNVDDVKQISQKLVSKLDKPKTTDKNDENEIILVLKSLANFGHLNDNILPKIIAIAQNKQASDRLRAIALETYLSDPCKDKIRNSALSILQDIQQDSEIRIKAYLVLAKCPNAKIGNAVKALLEKEPSYQVGGFITSHIRNIKASANPDKQLAKQFLSFSLPKKFPIDFRKWSFNGELSYSVDTLGLAASTEANVIYSQESPLPVSTNLNVTAEVFGQTFNLLEINTRQENLAKLVEHYFGPQGVFRRTNFAEMWKKQGVYPVNELWDDLNRKLDRSLRTRRDVSKAEIDSIGKAVQIKENVLNKDLDLDISVKAFGSEVLYKNLNVYQQGLTPDAIIDTIVKRFNEGLDRLKTFQEVFRTNILFLDVELDYPTSLGFPLRLAVEGTSNTQVKAEGGIDVRALLNNRDTNVNVKLIPSADIEITARMTLDALVVENGLKIVSNLYTATGADVKVQIFNNGKGVDVKVGLPVQNQKLLTARHEIVMESRDQAGPSTVTPLKFAQAKDFSICLDQLSPFIGLEFCAEINGPNLAGKQVPVLPFPLAGDAMVSVSIGNEDVKEYHLRAENKEYASGNLIVETIGKNGQKKLSFEIQSEITPQKYIKAIFTSPIKTAFVEGRITNAAQEKSLLLKAGQDQEDFYLKLGVGISGSGNKHVYSPILEYKAPGGPQQLPVQVDGRIIVEESGKSRKYIFDNLKLHLPNQKVVGITGNIGNDGDDVFSDVTVSEGPQSGSLKGRLHADANLLKLNAEVKNTLNPAFNFNLKLDSQRSTDRSRIDSNVQLIHGKDLASKTNIITFSNSLINKFKNPNDFAVGFRNKFAYPLIGLNFHLDAEQTQNSVDYEFDFHYNDIKFGSELEMEVNKKTLGDFDLEFQIRGLENKVELKSSREIEEGDKSKINNELDVNGMKLEVKGVIKHDIKPSNINVGADLTIILPTHPTPFKVDSGLLQNTNELDLHHKVTSGNVVVADVFLKANKNGNANGSVKVNIKNLLAVDGQLTAVKGKGTGHVKIDLLSMKKQVNLESTFEIQPPTTYNVVLTLYPNGQDKSQKLILSTNSKLTETHLESKNSLNLLGKELAVNLQASRTGTPDNKKHSGEVEIILPNNQYLLGKLNSHHTHTGDVHNGQGQASLEYRTNKNNAGRKVSLSADYKNIDPQLGLYDITYTIAADDANGKNINTDLVFKVQKQGVHRVIDTSGKIYGSILKQSIQSGLHFTYTKGIGEYELTSSYGPNVNGKLKGKYDVRGGNEPVLGEIELQMELPNPNLKTVKAKLAGSFLVPRDDVRNLQLRGTANLYADSPSSPEPLIDFSSEGQVKASDKDGEIKGNLKSTKLGPVSLVAGYSRKEDGDKKELNGNAALQYGNGKNLKIDGSLSKPNRNEYKLEIDLDTPIEDYRKNSLKVTTKKVDGDDNHVVSKIIGSHDNHKWTLDTEVKASDIAPIFDFKLACPKLQKVEVHLDGNKVSDKEFAVNYKLWCEQSNLLIEGNLDANLADVDNFSVKGKINAPKLDLDKITFEANNKPAKTGKTIHINVKSGANNLVSGTTSYTAHEEHGKYIIEGSGTLKVKNENKPANFKFISQQLTIEKNGEQGFEVSFDGGIGDKAVDAEYKVTNKQIRISDSYCEKKKECAHFEYDSRINENDVDKFNHVLEITIDLRKLGLPNEFGLKSVTNRKNWVIDHTVDIHFQSPENSKYQYSVYLHPQEAGVSLTTPKRIVSLEGHFNGPKQFSQNGGKLSAEVAFYLDKKNQPNQKAALSASLVSDQSKGNLKGEAKLSHPGLSRPLSVSIQASRSGELPNRQATIVSTIDIFAQPAQKIVAEYKVVPQIDHQKLVYTVDSSLTVKSGGLGIDLLATQHINVDRKAYSGEYIAKVKYSLGKSNHDNVLSVKGSKSGSNVLLRILNVDLLKVNNKYSLSKDEQVIDSEVSSYNNKALVSHLEVKKLNTVLYTIGCKDTPKEKLQISAGVVRGKSADLRADHVSGSGKVNIFHASVKLDDANFLEPDYNINSKELETVLTKSRGNIATFIDGLKNVGKELDNDIRKEVSQLSDITQKATPNVQPLKEYYVRELQKLKNEIIDDKSLQEVGELLKTIVFAVTDVASHVALGVAEVAEAVAHAVQRVVVALIDSIEKHIIPALKVLANSISGIVAQITETLVEIVSIVLASISQVCEKYQPEFKQLAATFGELGKDVTRFIEKSYEQVRKIVSNLYKRISEELKNVPVFEELRAQWEDFVKNGLPNTEGIIGGIKEIAATIKDLVPPELPIQPEFGELIDLTIDYLEKRIKQQPVNDYAVFMEWTTAFEKIARKILSVLTAETSDFQQPQLSFSLDFLRKLPKLVAVKFSPLDYILHEDPSKEIAAFALSLFNNPRQWVPPFPLFGGVLQGHIFTFDGQYLNFPANCKYLLARDAVNGNFTVAGTFANGRLTAVTVADHHDTITVHENGQVTVNNAHAELPARKPEISAYRNYDTITIESTAGVRVDYIPTLTACGVYVSGFYHAQLKGLLGKGNNEPYDDFTIPNGKIVTSASEFGNSYNIGNCPAVSVPGPAAKNPVCDKLFGWESSMRLCYPFVDTEIFKEACAHGLAANVPRTEFGVASAYVKTCWNHNIPVAVPSNLVKCTNGDEIRSVGDKFSVKVPGKSADIILLVDTVESNKAVYNELVKPLVQDLTKGLAAKGINDVEFHLITYGGENQWPSHITVGGKMTFKGKAPELKFSEEPKQKKIRYLEDLEDILEDLQLAFGQDLQARTYTEGYEYPFRAQAAKAIIAVTSRPCLVGKLYPLQKLRTLLFKDNKISLNLITPFNGLSVKDPKKTKDVIGFNDENIFTASQGKKKPEGSSELYKDLHYDDYCVDFTVKSRGNVFVTGNFVEGKPDFKKQFVHIASHNVIEELTNLEQGLDCECAVVGPYSARNVCREAYSKEKSSSKKGSAKA